MYLNSVPLVAAGGGATQSCRRLSISVCDDDRRIRVSIASAFCVSEVQHFGERLAGIERSRSSGGCIEAVFGHRESDEKTKISARFRFVHGEQLASDHS